MKIEQENLEQTLNDIQKSLKGRKLNLSNEKKLQEEIREAFQGHVIDYKREVCLENNGIVDFMIGTLAVEVKIKGQVSAMSIYRQLERYAKSDKVEALLLVTSHTMSIPETINGKPAYLLSLGRTQL